MFDINEIKKDLYKSKNMAKFSHYISGNLYYTVELADGTFQFIIPTVEKRQIMVGGMDEMDGPSDAEYVDVIKLSSDLGSTSFEKEMRGSELIRWVQKSINSNDFIKVG